MYGGKKLVSDKSTSGRSIVDTDKSRRQAVSLFVAGAANFSYHFLICCKDYPVQRTKCLLFEKRKGQNPK